MVHSGLDCNYTGKFSYILMVFMLVSKRTMTTNNIHKVVVMRPAFVRLNVVVLKQMVLI